MGETICQQCGDIGAQNALVFCVKCLDFAIHRYCLHVIPETLDEFVRWFCVDCEEEFGKPYPSKEISSVPSAKRGFIASEAPSRTLRTKPEKMKHYKPTENSSPHKLNVTREKENSSLLEATAEKRYENTLRPHGSQKEIAESDKIVHDYVPKAKKSKKSTSKKKKTLLARPGDVVSDLEEQKGRNSPFQESFMCDNENMVSEGDNLCIAGDDSVLDSQIVSCDSSNVPLAYEHIRAQPVIDTIWRGSLNIETDGYGLYDGLVAHLSSKAGTLVWEEAGLLSESLCMQLVPKESVWPKSFQKSEPSDDNIALYFFANKRCIKAFDDLVLEMMSRELALSAVVTNAQLLVFTSNELPHSFWTFNGKFYLWGVFINKKKAALPDSANCQSMVQSVGNGEDNIADNMALDSLSPISPLSNISSSGLRWTLPEAGELKLNVDATVISDTGQGAIGGLIRDKDGVWVYGFYMHLGTFNPETAQLCAIFKGLEIARKLEIPKLTLESDSEKAIEAVTSSSSDHPSYHYIEIIRTLRDRDWSCRIKLINREANICANRLTREAFNSMITEELPEPPGFMSTFLASDLQMGRHGKSCDVI